MNESFGMIYRVFSSTVGEELRYISLRRLLQLVLTLAPEAATQNSSPLVVCEVKMQVEDSSRPKIPLPTGWSDSSDDNKAGLCGDEPHAVEGSGAGGGGGGWDSSSDENGGGTWGGGKFREETGGIRNFERMAAESMREALLQNDIQLCDDVESSQETDARGLCDSGEAQEQDAQMSERFVPGDPFAAEKADVEAWAKHFTYLSITPTASWAPPREDEAGSSPTFGDLHATRLCTDGNIPASPEVGSMADPGHDEQNQAPMEYNAPMEQEDPVIVGVAITSSHPGKGILPEGTIGSNVNSTISEVAKDSAPGPSSSRVFSARFCAGEEDEEEGTNQAADRNRSTFDAHFEGLRGEEYTRTLLAPDEEHEELIACHGTYETFLAYDRRPPLTPADDDRHQETQGEVRVGATPTSSARLSAPQREIKEEIMDRLFEELWNRLIPELSMAATAATTNHNANRTPTKIERTASDPRKAVSSREQESTLSRRQ